MSESKRWFPGGIGEDVKEFGPLEFPVTIRVQLVPLDDPPKIGPDESPLKWSQLKTFLLVGDQIVGKPVFFPAHEPLGPTQVFTALVREAMKE